MIYRGKNVILQVQKDMLDLVEDVQQRVLKNIGAIYKGSQLIWLTVYDAVRSCFSSGTWYGERPWLGDDNWNY